MDLLKLSDFIQRSGVKKAAIASAIGISDASLRNKLAGRTDFLWKEVQDLAAYLHMTRSECSDIFFAAQVSESATFRRNS